ncbi:MAG: hypothetical protein J0M07_00340 [Anaerolineae bacterium]|nr:hypothetical protein [Anaerolineae bacterium]
MSNAQRALEHAKTQRSAYMSGFSELLRIPSISTDPNYKAEVARCADWVRDEMRRIGMKI